MNESVSNRNNSHCRWWHCWQVSLPAYLAAG